MTPNFEYRPYCALCESNRNLILFSEDFTNPIVWSFLEDYYQGRIKKTDLIGNKYEIAKCLKCGFLWQTFILDEGSIGQLYDAWIPPEESFRKRKQADISLFSTYAREVQVIASLILKRPFEIEVLDFGMGWGFWCRMAKAFGYNVWGYEISKSRIENARKNGIAVLENLSDIKGKEFDFINAEQVFEHIPNPLQTLTFLTRSLKEEGKIRVSVPNGRRIEKKLSKKGFKTTKDAIQPLEHINCFTHKTLVKFGKLGGLELMRQPFLMSNRPTLKSYLKGIMGRYYNQFFNTTLYFKKNP